MATAPAVSLRPDQLYLVRYSEDGSLYRAALQGPAPEDKSQDKVDVFFVDYGNSSTVPRTDIWELSTIGCEVVQELPRQALRELVPETQAVMLKVSAAPSAASLDCPLVELHLPNSKDGSINFDLSTELDLFPLS